MNRLGYRLLATSFIALGACAEPATAPVEGLSSVNAAPASGVLLNETTRDVVSDMFNPCNGEQIIGTARHHVLVQTIDTKSGNTMVNFDYSQDFTGVGQATGVIYNAKLRSNSNFALGSDRSIVAASDNEMHVIAVGKAPNFDATVRVHITITPNGVPTANKEIVDAACQGA